MQTVILAAGENTRFRESFDGPFIKQSLPVNQSPILIRSIESLHQIGCTEIVLVVGSNKHQIKQLIDEHYLGNILITYVENQNPERGNGYSLGLAQDYVDHWFYLTMSDHIFDNMFMQKVKDAQQDDAPTLYVDYKIDQVFDLDDATKVLEKDGQIQAIGKRLLEYNCIDTGFFYLNEEIFKSFNNLERSKKIISISDIIQQFSKMASFKVTDIKDALWQDVDDMDMYEHAKKIFGKLDH